MRSGGMLVRAAVVTLVASTTAGCGGTSTLVPGLPGPGAADRVDPADYAAALVAGTNDARAGSGLPALADSACAREGAAPRAAVLRGEPHLEHAPLDEVLAACSPRTTAAENLSRAAASPQQVIDAWLDSPGHRQNLLSPSLTEVGVACVSDDGAMLCSQVFLGP